jgi:transmembrane sensor
MRRRAFLGGALAASAATAAYLAARSPAGSRWSVSGLLADYRTGTGERRSVTIDDVVVQLNTRSSLNVLPTNGTARRLELVAGEAAFATGGVREAPVVLVAGGGEVSATEAKFDVRCDAAAVSVVCLQGVVKVDYQRQVAVLREHQRIIYGTNGLDRPTPIDAAVATAWREGWLIFHGTPLSEVIDEVNRYRPSRIILMNETLGSRPVNATLPLDHLDEVMALLREAYGIKVLSLPGGIVVLT